MYNIQQADIHLRTDNPRKTPSNSGLRGNGSGYQATTPHSPMLKSRLCGASQPHPSAAS